MNLSKILLLGSLLFGQVAVAGDLPQRWVSSGGSLSEWIVALGGEDKLVGVDTTSQHPESLRKLASVGYQRALSAEGILALRPDILVGSEEMGPPPVLEQIKAAGVRIENLPATAELDVVDGNVRRLGELLGDPDRAEQLMTSYRGKLEERARWVEQARQSQDAPRVLMLLGHAGGNVLAAGRESLAAWLIEHAGGLSVTTHDGYKPISNEAILAMDPQVVIFADRTVQGDEARQALLQQTPVIAQTSAGRNGRVVILDPTLLVGGLGPRLPESLADLSAAFYPSVTALADEADR